MSIFSAQFLAAAYCVTMLAISGKEPDDELYKFAFSLPTDHIYANGCTIMDLNSDGMPEVYLTASSGWQYHVFYYLDGEIHDVEDMTPWAWSNRLLYTSDGRLVMYTFPHTYGTDGILNYRVWRWGEEGYFLAEDLWRIPKEWEWNGEGDMNDPNNFVLTAADYISSDIATDPFEDESPYDNLLITQEEFERRTEGFDEAEIILNPYGTDYQWEFDWWREFGREDMYDDEAYAIIRAEIAGEILNWK